MFENWLTYLPAAVAGFLKAPEAPTPQPQATPTRAWTRGQEVAWQHSYLFGQLTAPYNPDELVSKKGLMVFERMAHDEQLKAAGQIIEMATLSPGFDVLPPELPADASEGRKQEGEAHARFIKFCLNEMRGSYDDKLGDVLTARVFGFSVSELIFNPVTYGEFSGKITVSDLKTRHPWGIDFQTDEFGNLKAVMQANRPLPIGKFMIYTHRKRLGNFYGQSEFRAAYRSWFIKDAVVKFMTVALERHACPIPKFSSETGQSLTDSQRTSMESFIANLQVKTGIILPPGVQLAFEHPDARTDNIFIPCLRYLDDCLRLSQLCPALIGMAAEQVTGSLARSGTEFETFMWVIQKLRLDLQTLHDEQLIKPLIDLNFEVDDGLYPRFQFNAMTEAIRERIYKNWLAGVQGKSLTHTLRDENKARELIGFEPLDEDEYQAGRQAAPTTEFFKRRYQQSGRANFAAIKEFLDGAPRAYLGRLREQLKGSERGVIEWFKARPDLTVSDVAKFEWDLGTQLETDLVDLLKQGYRTGFSIAAGELPGKIGDEVTTETPVVTQALNVPFYGEQGAEVRKLKRKYQDAFGPGFAPVEAIEALLARASLIKGTITDEVRNQIKFELASHLQYGRTQAETIQRLRDIFRPWVGDDEEGLLKAPRLLNIIRTETAYSLNAGRAAVADGTSYVTGVEISGILDDRQTDVCRTADGLRIPKGHPDYQRCVPPLHFSCRSTVIMITTDEEQDFSSEDEIARVVGLIDPRFK